MNCHILYHDNCFDGAASAAVFMRFYLQRISPKATFTLFEKVHAKGTTTEPYTTLNQADPAGDVDWNFEKFLIDKRGNVLMRYKSAIEPNNSKLKAAIENALAA